MNALRVVIPAALLSAAAFAQTAPPRLEFEVASVKPSPPPAAGQVLAGIKIDGAQLHSRSLALRDYIQSAYKVKNYQVEGPAWLGSERYEIDAKLPARATREQVPEMLQALFADRFELKIHRETKNFPVYGLVVAKGGLKVEEVPIDTEEIKKGNVDVAATAGAGGTSVALGHSSSFSINAHGTISGGKLTMQMLADLLARFTDKPVGDMTARKGGFTFTLPFTPAEFRAMMVPPALA